MVWPSIGDIRTGNMDSGSDSAAAARADFYDAMTALAAVIAARGAPDGIAGLDGTGKLFDANLPTLLNLLVTTGALTINDLKIVLGVTNSVGRMVIPFAFPGVLAVGSATDPQSSFRWKNEFGFPFRVQNVQIMRTINAGSADSLLTMAGLGQDLAIEFSNDLPQTAAANYDTGLLAGTYQATWRSTDTYVSDSSLVIQSGSYLSLFPSSVSGSPPESVFGQIEGYLQNA